MSDEHIASLLDMLAKERELKRDRLEISYRKWYRPDWEVFSRKIEAALTDACALMVELDLESYRCMMNHFHSLLDLNKNSRILTEKNNKEMNKHMKYVERRLIDLIKIKAVVADHVNYRMLKIRIREPSQEEKDYSKRNNSLYDREAIVPVVNLAEFGTWAKSLGYKLPPRFPLLNEPQKRQVNVNAANEKHKREFNKAVSDIRPLFEGLLSGKEKLTDTKGRVLDQEKWSYEAFIRCCEKHHIGYGKKMIKNVFDKLRKKKG